MAMRKSTRSELMKLRELVRFTLRDTCCFLCKKELFADDSADQDGNGRGKPIDVQITIHHVDGNHDNNERSNKRLVHTSCHKRFHARLCWKIARRAKRGLPLSKRDRWQVRGGFFMRRQQVQG